MLLTTNTDDSYAFFTQVQLCKKSVRTLTKFNTNIRFNSFDSNIIDTNNFSM